MIAENNERKRNILWRTAISVSFIVIILIAVYFIVRMFTANPMEGSWVDEDSGRMIEIQGNEIAKVEWQDEADGSLQVVNMAYTLDRDSKIFSLHVDEVAVEKAVESGMSKETVENVVTSLEGNYDYNIEQNVLTLTEREYGDQMTFEKQ